MKIFVLFNLKPGVDRKTYEDWARGTDLPVVNGLGSVSSFRVFAATGLLGGDGAPPYQFIEVIDVADMERFGSDVASKTMQRVAGEFQAFADAPVFITSSELTP